MGNSLIKIDGVSKQFLLSGGFFDELAFKNGKLTREKRQLYAVNDVSLTIKTGESLCVVGESGCGKSTLARVIMGLLSPSAGVIEYDGDRIDDLNYRQRFPYRRKMQMIFQDPYASLNPRMKTQETLSEPVRFHFPQLGQQEVTEKVHSVMQSIGIDPSWATRYPHEFSGGQRQRISIARALAVEPEFIVADEPISALDVSIQAQVLNLLADIQEKHSLTYLFITHDLSVVEHFGTRVVVMYLGTICELAETKTLFSSPKHPYTKVLLSAIPRLDKRDTQLIRLEKEIPTPLRKPEGCVFQSRCPQASQRCFSETPVLRKQSDNSVVACHNM